MVKVVVVVKNAVVRVVVVVVVKAKTRKKINRHSYNKDIKARGPYIYVFEIACCVTSISNSIENVSKNIVKKIIVFLNV